MQKTLKLLTIILSLVLLVLSCRQEEFEYFPPEDQPTLANSMVADLLERTALNDGSIDNIIDRSNCFTVQLPVAVKVNGAELLVNSEEDFAAIEAFFDAFDDDEDVLEIIFPITIILNDFSEVFVANSNDFDTYSSGCNGENVPDDDIECLDMQYPITASIFNRSTEGFETLTITSDWQLYHFIDDLSGDDIVNFDFPLSVRLADGAQMNISNLLDLEQVIDDVKDNCDEDDDYDFNDDDCNNCTLEQLSELLTGCSSWTVDKLERNNNDLEDSYAGYQFTFREDGTLSGTLGANTFPGVWEFSGSGNNIFVDIDIPSLPDFNANWNLHEIEQDKVDLRLGGDDRLRFESNCMGNGGDGNGNTGSLTGTLADGLWEVDSYTEDSDDQTGNYSGYTLNFNSDGIVVADNGTAINGTWASQNSDSELALNFGNAVSFDEFNDTWDVISISDNQVTLQDVSGGNGGTDTLILSKQ